ncbi:MAG: Imm44 family immunity protein [Acutalibacteraceae bacterium]|nr:Imm44 family immunity protein [Acutalibacteraceae bacterium]
MELFLSIEAQNADNSGLADILRKVTRELSFVTDKNKGLENIDNYGLEFKSIAIIPTCVDDDFWVALGWKERIKISRKNRAADIRLRMDYNRFVAETNENKRIMFIKIIIESIKEVQSRSKKDFNGDKLIEDIFTATNLTEAQVFSV